MTLHADGLNHLQCKVLQTCYSHITMTNISFDIDLSIEYDKYVHYPSHDSCFHVRNAEMSM